jgi:hypothetical protein
MGVEIAPLSRRRIPGKIIVFRSLLRRLARDNEGGC